MQRLRAELQKDHQARISSQEEQRTRLEEELEKSRAMVASLEGDQSKIKVFGITEFKGYRRTKTEFQVQRVLLNGGLNHNVYLNVIH